MSSTLINDLLDLTGGGLGASQSRPGRRGRGPAILERHGRADL
jgi:hypothetical protein